MWPSLSDRNGMFETYYPSAKLHTKIGKFSFINVQSILLPVPMNIRIYWHAILRKTDIEGSLGEFYKDSQISCTLCLFRGLSYPHKTKFSLVF